MSNINEDVQVALKRHIYRLFDIYNKSFGKKDIDGVEEGKGATLLSEDYQGFFES